MRRLAATAAAMVVLVTGFAACSDDEFNPGPGAETTAGRWKTWALTSSAEIDVPSPPTGADAEREADEVRQLSSSKTAEDEASIARWGQSIAVKPWLEMNMELVAAGVKDPPLASRGYALTSIAMYDAVVAAYHWKYEHGREGPEGDKAGPDPSYPSEHAAIAGAASRILTYLFPDRPFGLFDELAEEAAESRVKAGANFRSDVEAGLELGRAVAEKVLARAKADGSDQTWDGQRPAGIGTGIEYWQPAPGTVAPPTQPLAGVWKPWVLESGKEFRAGPPYAYGSPEFLAEVREVMEVRKNITPEQEQIARFWAGGQGTPSPPGLWNQIALVYAAEAKMTTPRAARLFAALNVAESDAALSVWDTKFTYWTARPINAIRDLGLDPTWTPVLTTPNFPSYVSGHAGYSGAAAVVLSHFFPANAGTFEAKAQEAAISRLYGGIHYASDNNVGLDMGHKVGRKVVDVIKRDGSEI